MEALCPSVDAVVDELIDAVPNADCPVSMERIIALAICAGDAVAGSVPLNVVDEGVLNIKLMTLPNAGVACAGLAPGKGNEASTPA